MRSLHRNVPSPKSLIAMEAAARHMSFTAASEELHVTQAAVTYQIQKLEQELGVPLFIRSHRRLELTWAGERLLSAVRYGLGHIAETAFQIRRVSAGNTLTVAANSAVSFYWLRDKAIDFQIAHPGTELRILSGETDDIESLGSGIDLAIRHGDGQWPGLTATLLFEESSVPVCSPAYEQANGPLKTPADLLKGRLLQLEPMSPDWLTWETWFADQGVDFGRRKPPETVTFNSYPVLLEAAIAGQGIALGGLPVIDRVLEEGRLNRMATEPYRTGLGYYLVQPGDRPGTEAAIGFERFLLERI